MAKSVIIAYLCWLIGGWFGLHLFYLGRDRQAFVWWCLLAGYGGVGWFGDFFTIPRYVKEANLDNEWMAQLAAKIQRHPIPPFSLYRFIGQVIFGNLLAWVTFRAIPIEHIGGISLFFLHWLIPVASAIGVYTVGNIGREKGSIKFPLIIATITYAISYLVFPSDEPRYYLVSFVTALSFRWVVEWRRNFNKRSFCSRCTILLFCSFLYISLWGSYLYFNMTIENEHGETIKLRESIHNLLKSPLWKELKESVVKLWQFYRINGWSLLWKEIMVQLDPMGERSALEILELPESASQEEITAKWRQMSKKYHPDKFRDPEAKEEAQKKFMEIKEAYEKISVINAKRKKMRSRSHFTSYESNSNPDINLPRRYPNPEHTEL